MIETSDIDVYLGLDVGKGEHHATALTPAGKKTFDRRLPNSEPKLREVFGKLKTKHGTVLRPSSPNARLNDSRSGSTPPVRTTCLPSTRSRLASTETATP